MEGKIRFQRYFLIFNQEDGGFGNGQEPSGYVKIEAREGKGKLSASVQNLREDQGRINYKLYIIGCDDRQVYTACVGTLPLQKNKCEIQWEFNPDNVAATGRRIDGFGAAVVLVEYKDRTELQIVCPLAAYKNKKFDWRDKLKARLYPEEKRNDDNPKEVLKNKEVYSKHESILESKYAGREKPPAVDPLEVKNNLVVNVQDMIPIVNERTDDKTGDRTAEIAGEITPKSVEPDKEAAVLLSDNPSGRNEEAQSSPDENVNILAQADNTGGSKPNADDYGKLLDKSINEDLYGTNPEKFECIFKSNTVCPARAVNQGTNPCAGCLSQNTANQVKNAEKAVENNIDSLKRMMDKYFEISDPFGSRRKDYKWWKVNSPVYLNNILYQCGIRTPLLFNPVVITANFKYRHMIAGIYSDKARRREYIVCGIPGVYGIDDKPFGDMCRWVQLEGSRPKYGAFGYWLVYIDPKTGKFLPLN